MAAHKSSTRERILEMYADTILTPTEIAQRLNTTPTYVNSVTLSARAHNPRRREPVAAVSPTARETWPEAMARAGFKPGDKAFKDLDVKQVAANIRTKWNLPVGAGG